MNINNKLILEIDNKKLKVIEGFYSGNVLKINKAISLDLDENIYNDGIIENLSDLTYEISELLKENKISRKSCYLVLNSTKIISRNINIPNMSLEDMISFLNYKVEEYMPIKKEDYVINQIVLETAYNNISLMLFCAPREMVKKHKELIESLKLKAKVLDYQGNTISKLLKYNNTINDLYKINKINIATVDISDDFIRINIIESGILKFSRFTNFKESIMKENVNIIIETIEATFKYYQLKNESNIVNIILLHGDNDILDYIEQDLSAYFQIPAVKLKKLDNVDFNNGLWKFANCIGALIRK